MTDTSRIGEALERLARQSESRATAAQGLVAELVAWLKHVHGLEHAPGPGLESACRGIYPLVDRLVAAAGTPETNRVVGQVLSQLVACERRSPHNRAVMERMVGPQIAKRADADRALLIIVNTHLASTRMALFRGIVQHREGELHPSPDRVDSVEARAAAVLAWLRNQGVDLRAVAGIACRGGFVAPLPSGTYRVGPEMLVDLASPRIEHHTNLAIGIGATLLEQGAGEGKALVTTTDPVAIDEVEPVELLTGLSEITRDGTAAHYLNHKAVARLIASLLGRDPARVDIVTAHLGTGISVAAHREGRVTSVVDAYSIPSTNRTGTLDTARLVAALKANQIALKDLEAAVHRRGGLLSLTGTDDFRALEAFARHGATTAQRQKIQLVLSFLARQVAAAILRVTADGRPSPIVALTGSLSRSRDLVSRIERSLGGRHALVVVPGSLENESLAAGLICALHDPSSLRDYVTERNALRERREAELTLLRTPVFKRRVYYKKTGAPIVSLDELIDAARISVHDRVLPTIVIVGATNEEAVLAAKKANEAGHYRIAKFVLVGDFAEVSAIAYDYDLVIDGDNYKIADSDSPLETAVELLATGAAQIVMKGSVKTDEILRGVFRLMKEKGRIEKGQVVSHVAVMDIPTRSKLLLITDAAVNPYPDVERRVAIVENALVVARSLHITRPKVAVISALESVNPSVESTVAARQIADHFAGRSDCVVEGPLSFDVAMDPAIAQEKKFGGEIKGTADIVLMPDIDAGNVLYKTLTTQSGASVAGVIMCGSLPIVLTSRGDSARSKLASISLAVKLFADLSARDAASEVATEPRPDERAVRATREAPNGA